MPASDRITCGGTCEPFLSIVVIQIFFTGSLFFVVAALTRKIFIVYLQGVALFMIYLVGVTVFSATRSLEHFWSGILDPVGLLLNNAVARYWSVVEKNTQLFPWDFSGDSPGVFLFNRLLWIGVGVAAMLIAWALFPLSVEALTARAQGKRAARARQQEAAIEQRKRSFVAVQLPRVRQLFGPGTSLRQYLALTGLENPAHFEGSAVLGHRRPAVGFCREQRTLCRPRGRCGCLAGDLLDGSGRGRLGDPVLLHRCSAVCS